MILGPSEEGTVQSDCCSVHATSSEPVKCHVVSHKSAKIKRGVKKTPSLRRQRDRPRSVGYRVAGAGAGPFPSPPLPLLPRLHFAHLKDTIPRSDIFSCNSSFTGNQIQFAPGSWDITLVFGGQPLLFITGSMPRRHPSDTPRHLSHHLSSLVELTVRRLMSKFL